VDAHHEHRDPGHDRVENREDILSESTDRSQPNVSGMLFQVQPHDMVTYAGVVGILGLLSLSATYLPARRATRIDPLLVLRQE
jgi:ABC-type lipoprotein release transport system permease subunit